MGKKSGGDVNKKRQGPQKEKSECPIVHGQILDLLKVAISADEDSSKRTSSRGDPQVVFVQRQAFLLTRDLYLSVVVTCLFGYWLARKGSEERRCLCQQFLLPFAWWQALNAIENLSPHKLGR